MKIILDKEEYLKLKPNLYIDTLIADIERYLDEADKGQRNEHSTVVDIQESIKKYKQKMEQSIEENLLW